jgi:ssRNA-specific RNase YbeY (16S rRNA maturation enzyme)
MIHGILHLCGYGDKTAEQVAEMREKENYYLSL